jgi:hypothetical protein
MSEEPGGVQKTGFRMRTLARVMAISIIITASGAGAWYLLGGSSYESPSVPTCDLVWDAESGLKFVIGDPKLSTVSWSDVVIYLEATPIDSDPYELAFWRWYPTQENLTRQNSESITLSMEYPRNSTLVSMFCNLTDVSGDGYVGDGDFFALASMTDHANLTGIPCYLGLVYKPMDGVICSLKFTPEAADDGTDGGNAVLYMVLGGAVIAMVLIVVIAMMLRKKPRTPQTTSREPGLETATAKPPDEPPSRLEILFALFRIVNKQG